VLDTDLCSAPGPIREVCTEAPEEPLRRHLSRSFVFITIVAGVALAAAHGQIGRVGQAASHVMRTAASTSNTSVLGGGEIRHVVLIYQENHSFDNVLGLLCVQDLRCQGTTTGKLHDGKAVFLTRASDRVVSVDHSNNAQATAVNGGAMDHFDLIKGCTNSPLPPVAPHQCYTQYDPSQIPNLAASARQFALSDRTFELSAVPSFGAHVELVAGQLDGFTGDNPKTGAGPPVGKGWGCDSNKDAPWAPNPSTTPIKVPSCVPTPDGRGPYRSSPVHWIPTIMDRLDAAGRSWTLYTGNGGYNWAICPTFADCLLTGQHNHVANPTKVISDAGTGVLPAFSLVLPEGPNGNTSQHNATSMIAGDNWIGQVLTALERGPEWSSTAVFMTYDDCGCFYDHVAPPAGLGIRVPMVIVSPFAKKGFTDTSTASFASMLAFTEHVYGLAPLASADAFAYDYANSFDWKQTPQVAGRLTNHPVPVASPAEVAANPVVLTDPT
jgi:phospholipase C